MIQKFGADSSCKQVISTSLSKYAPMQGAGDYFRIEGLKRRRLGMYNAVFG